MTPSQIRVGNEEPTVSTLLQRAIALHQAGDLGTAQQIYAEILERQPNNVDALYLDGLIAHQRGQYPRAQQCLQAALRIHPMAPAIHTALGNTHRDQGHFEQAETCYQAALRLDTENANAHYNSGIAYHERGDLARAITAYRRAVAVNSLHPESWNNLGVALKASGDIDQAAACYAKTIALQPRHAMCLFNLGVLHADEKRFEEALAYYRRALEAQPAYAEAAFNAGVASRNLGQLDEAVQWFERALVLHPQHAGALHNLGATQHELGRLDAADACYRHALTTNPDNPQVHYNLALIALARGDYARGWEAFEWRWRGAESSRLHRRDFPQPQWRGEDIAGQTILLHAEQGLGDTLQFVRYAPLVAARGARVILECQPPLVRLLQSMPGIDVVVPAGETLPSFDWHCPLMSLPLAFGTRLNTVPAHIPYLEADERLAEIWQQRLGGERRRKVGLVWAGNPRRFSLLLNLIDQRRSLRLSQFAPLARCSGVSFFSLQLGEAASETVDPPASLALNDFTNEIKDFSDTAALIANLDLVISVDTSVVHLAGALGKPVWMLSRHDACWRWLLQRDDSPWYPTLRIFRQPGPGDWTSVIERVASELEELGINSPY